MVKLCAGLKYQVFVVSQEQISSSAIVCSLRENLYRK